MEFQCGVCRTRLSAEPGQAGALVRCPKCFSTLRVPGPVEPMPAPPPPPPAAPPPLELREPTPAPSHQAPPWMPEYAPTSDDAPPTGAMPPPPRAPARAPAGAAAAQSPTPALNQAARTPAWIAAQMGQMRSSNRRYGFSCPYCSSRLEATETMGAQEGQCPTCGTNITIPILDRYGRLIDPLTQQIIKPDPHPVHAYAAAGERAPLIVKQPDGSRMIACQRCQRLSPLTANNCRHCQMPFTMEGTTVEASQTGSGMAVASLVLGIIGLPAFCTIVVPLLAIILGAVALVQSGKDGVGGRGMAIAGIVCGAVACLIALIVYAM